MKKLYMLVVVNMNFEAIMVEEFNTIDERLAAQYLLADMRDNGIHNTYGMPVNVILNDKGNFLGFETYAIELSASMVMLLNRKLKDLGVC